MPVKKATTFEQAMDRLDEIVVRLDGGGATLDESLKLFGEGAQLLGFCEKKLGDARLTVEKLFPTQAEEDA